MATRHEHDIVIVGGGLVGLSLARALAETGLTLALVEPQPPAASSLSWSITGGWDNRVYTVSPERRCWSDFEETISRHHAEPGFGPFLTGLRVVRIGPEAMLTIRDDVRTESTPDSFVRSVMKPRELTSFIENELGLGQLPVEDAVRGWCEATGRA